MSISKIRNPASVIKALDEYEKLGAEGFHNKYGFRDSTSYFVYYKDNYYPSKAILGVAYGFEYPGNFLKPSDFSGGKTVEQKLTALSFQVVVKNLKDKKISDEAVLVEQVEVTSLVFKRKPDVVEQTLSKAKGKCERCEKPAPFNKPDGVPFLEVHHLVQLKHGGMDRITNTLALCPNCHREMHHGTISDEEFLRLKRIIESRENCD